MIQEPSEQLIVYDEHDRCPYLPGQVARMPLRLPLEALSREQFDLSLAAGDRRTGTFLYRPSCPACTACEALRIPAARFRPTATQRRVRNRGDRLTTTRVGRPKVDARRVELYNLHKQGRDLLTRDDDRQIDADDYAGFLVETCCETIEFSYYHEQVLFAVAVADLGATSLSAVYCCFDPAYEWLSPGTYSILKQIEWCRRKKLEWLYLGLHVAGCSKMSYKTNFHPHERLIAGRWQPFDKV